MRIMDGTSKKRDKKKGGEEHQSVRQRPKADM